MSRSAFSHTPNARDNSAIRRRMDEITQMRIHYGCECVQVMLRRGGLARQRSECASHLRGRGPVSIRHCRPRHSRQCRRRQPLKVAIAPNTLWWGMDFVSDALFDGRRFRLLPVLDQFTHE